MSKEQKEPYFKMHDNDKDRYHMEIEAQQFFTKKRKSSEVSKDNSEIEMPESKRQKL